MNNKDLHFDILVVGGGPGGLACAKRAAEAGFSVALFERKSKVGPKVCAGGITWNGLKRYYPQFETERDFDTQLLKTSFQNCSIKADHPIVSTVDRIKLGSYMAASAIDAGATIHTNHYVKSVTDNYIHVFDKATNLTKKYTFSYLVGADGSTSTVRRFLNIPVIDVGVGVNYFLPNRVTDMEWHIKPTYFKNGYGWVFPHNRSVSIGAYCPRTVMSGSQLKNKCSLWAQNLGYNLSNQQCSAELINYDFKGLRFGSKKNIFLVGDAAGLASGLTGEGIYPAIVSGEGVVEMIQRETTYFSGFEKMLKNHKRHQNILTLAGKSRFSAVLLSELMAFGYRTKKLKFDTAEMA